MVPCIPRRHGGRQPGSALTGRCVRGRAGWEVVLAERRRSAQMDLALAAKPSENLLNKTTKKKKKKAKAKQPDTDAGDGAP